MRSKRFSWSFAILLTLFLAAVSLELYATRGGLGVRDDSVRYVMGARNLLDGIGFSRISGGGEVFPETGFAPLLSFALAGMGLARIDMYAGARLLNSLLFGTSVLLSGLLIAEATRSRWMGLLGASIVLTAPNVFRWHLWLMSEALFIFLVLLSLYAMVRHLKFGGWGPLVLSAAAAGLASLARYAGVGLIPAGVVGILIWGRGARSLRWSRALTFALVAGLPFVLWMGRNSVVGGPGLANREFRYHPFRPEVLRVFLFEPTSWLLPASIVLPRAVRGFVALVTLAVGPILFVWKEARQFGLGGPRERASLPWILLVLIPAYVAVLVFNSLFLDAGTTIDGILRYLTPLYVLFVLLEVTTLAVALPSGRWRPILAGAIGLWVVALTGLNLWETATLARDSTDVMGYTRIREESPELAAALKAAPVVIADNPEMVYYLADRTAYMIPIKFDPYQQAFREDYAQQIELARSRMESGAILVIFGTPNEAETEVLQRLEVSPLLEYSEAVVYGYPG